jgi:hypothetical protein
MARVTVCGGRPTSGFVPRLKDWNGLLLGAELLAERHYGLDRFPIDLNSSGGRLCLLLVSTEVHLLRLLAACRARSILATIAQLVSVFP